MPLLNVDYGTFISWLATVNAYIYYIVDGGGNYNITAQLPDSQFVVGCYISSGDPNISAFLTNLAPIANLQPSTVQINGAVASSPAANTVLATTGTIATAGNYTVQAVVSCTNACVFSLQTIVGGSVTNEIYLMVPGHGTFDFKTQLPFPLPANATLSIVNTVAVVLGTAQANIFYALA
jgi:hypothetical protein